jgi:quercetin dioxygenase-like cupin family protein
MIISKIKYVTKGWGHEKWIVNKPAYCGKLLFFDEGKQCSWHYHKIKDEVLFVHSGKINLLYSDDEDIDTANSIILGAGQAFHVYPGLKHRMIALEETKIYEFSTQHFDEDSIRIHKGD